MSTKKIYIPTYLKYILSYFLIIIVLLTGFLFILRQQLSQRFVEQNEKELQTKLENANTWFYDNYINLQLISDSLNESISSTTASYIKLPSRKYHLYAELDKYNTSSRLIHSIVYKLKESSELIHTYGGLNCVYEEDSFHINMEDSCELIFNPSKYYGAGKGKYIFLSNESEQLFLYFPHTPAHKSDLLFFILDTNLIQQQLENIVTSDVSAIALMNENKQIIAGIKADKLDSYIKDLDLTGGAYPQDSHTSVYVCTDNYSELSLVCLTSDEHLLAQVNGALSNSYIALFLLSLLGSLLVWFAMRLTYSPLHHLVQKIVPAEAARTSYLDLLESTFYKAEEENQLLQNKLEYYRTSMQKSLLNSMILSPYQDDADTDAKIDQFFDFDPSKEIFVIRMSSPGKNFPSSDMPAYFQSQIPSCISILLETEEDTAVYLINYTGTELHKEHLLLQALNQCYIKHGYLSAISSHSNSPLDIPALYEDALRASKCWPEIPVADCHSVPPAATSLNYPHQKLKILSTHLNEYHFSESHNSIDELFEVIQNSVQSESLLPDFFVHCILIDMLTCIINNINQNGIKYKSYSELYSETLYYCRSCPYEENADILRNNIHALIDFYAQEISNMTIDFSQVLQHIQSSYAKPDYSITLLADHFQISIAYMSNLFKKNLNKTFSDYLWELRLKKASELLISSDLTIDEISVAIGYLNTSSFCRKFKQKIGVTPTQYRNENK